MQAVSMDDRNSVNIQTNTPTVDAVHHNILKQSLNMITSKNCKHNRKSKQLC